MGIASAMHDLDSRSDVPLFHVAIPFLSSGRSRVNATLASLLGQTALQSHRAALKVTLVTDEPSSVTTLHRAEQTRNVDLEVKQDRVPGMYNAIADALEHSEGDFITYLGAGDTLEPQAFDIALEIAPPSRDGRPWWMTGYIASRREDGAIVRVTLPYRYRSRFFETGIHGSVLPTIQQESTIWNGVLNSTMNYAQLRQFALAGDYFLWHEFSRTCEPQIVEAIVGSFSWHGDNQSADWATYRAEVDSLTRRPQVADRLLALWDAAMWALPPRLRLKFRRGTTLRYRWPEGPWQCKA
jgi:hypothetical protein